MSRLDDADAILDGRMHAEGGAVSRPAGHAAEPMAVIAAVAKEATPAALSIAQASAGFLNLSELFLQAFLVGLAAAHAEGLEWTEWLLTSKDVPAIDLGIVRAAARRIAAGAS